MRDVKEVGDKMLVGRESEVALLDRLFEESAHGSGSLLFVSGPVGCGKSALLQALVTRTADSGALVLTAAGARSEQDLPMGLVAQLLFSERLPSGLERVVMDLFGGGLPERLRATNDAAAARPAVLEISSRLCAELLEVAEKRTVVFAIDDAHFADAESLQVLLYLQRRMRNRRMLFLLAELSQVVTSAMPTFHTELYWQPNCHRIRLDPLSPEDVERAVRGRLGDESVVSATSFHQLSGGNPRLLWALVEQGREQTGPVLDAGAVEAFQHAFSACLHRAGDDVTEVARAMAAAGDATDTMLVSRLAGLSVGAVEQALLSLSGAGLIDGVCFRHPRAAVAVLSTLSLDEHADLYLRAARLLHALGMPDRTVAAALVSAAGAPEEWMIDVLLGVAQEVAGADDTGLAVASLELVLVAGRDERQRTVAMAELARMHWRESPAESARYLPQLRAALARGRLDSAGAGMLVRHLLWSGRTGEAVDAVVSWAALIDSADTGAVSELQSTRSWLRCSFPAVFSKVEGRLSSVLPTETAAGPAGATLAYQALTTTFSAGSTFEATSDADMILRGAQVSDVDLEPSCAALWALICADLLDEAEARCDALLGEASRRHAVVWAAVLGAVRAEISYRRGDYAAAATQAREALDAMPAADWGVAIGGPLATLVLALTELRRCDEAAEVLGLPVPDSMFESLPGLRYQYARGYHSLVRQHFTAALADFEACGRWITEWGMDLPAFLPWRSGVARALIGLGQGDTARELMESQLMRPGVDGSRTHGSSLRIIAAGQDAESRIATLWRAVDMLRADSARLELARVLSGLSDAYYELGDLGRARTLAERAQNLVNEADANAPWPPSVSVPVVWEPSETSAAATLSAAERPVAVLAARGHTNREIGIKLFITVSTVEQHLTRVYRKLKVSSRSELAALIAPEQLTA